MARVFNTTGSCHPELHYMVNIENKLVQIKKLIDSGAYFTINRARQYGKTTTIEGLRTYLEDDYIVLSLDFQAIGSAEFQSEERFCTAFAQECVECIQYSEKQSIGINMSAVDDLEKAADSGSAFTLRLLFKHIRMLCETAEKPIVLMIDEVDSATNNQVFLDFLAQLRLAYLNRARKKTFQSVILAGVHDVKNIRYKIRPEEEHKVNSPWNIAAIFKVNMSFSVDDIEGMLHEYEADYHTGMDISEIAGLIYDYTSGYPFLVSRVCQIIDEDIAGTEEFPSKADAWTNAGFTEAVKVLICEKNTLYESLIGKIINYPELKKTISEILFTGRQYEFVTINPDIEMAAMYGFIKNEYNKVAISNRIFESVLYRYFLSEEAVGSKVYDSALSDQSQFIVNGRLDMKHILERFIETFDDIYGDQSESFVEEVGRKYFMLYLKPIINGTGHSYVEARTRNFKRTDMIVQYHGEQFVIEMKIWNGPKYHEEGEQQLTEYLDSYHLDTGYMLTFNFNKKKERGIKEKIVNGKVLIEGLV